MMWPIPSWLLEAGNFTLAFLLPWVILTAWRYLNDRRRDSISFIAFYHENKMAIATMVLFCGFEIRTLVAAVIRHVNSHSGAASDYIELFFRPHAVALYSLGTLACVMGALCWARVAAGMPIRKPLVWVVAAASLLLALWISGAPGLAIIGLD